MLDVDSINSFTSKKIISIAKAKNIISAMKKNGKTVGLCHGGFDLLHPGHIKHFESAKKLCDILFVSITYDEFVTKRKHIGRPIFTDKLRAYAVAAIEFVDYVVISEFERAIEPIHILQPSYYIKGPDFIHKKTPGITVERKAIKEAGGEIKYTDDPTFSTTKIIDYIKNNINRDKILLVIDRDGTIIEDANFLGRYDAWGKNVKLKKNIVDFLSYIQTKINATSIVITNQSGVARGYFDCARVEKINSFIDALLKKYNVRISSWQYCPDVDLDYVKKTKFKFNKKFTKKITKRKPHADMVYDALKELKMKLNDFSKVLVVGDSLEDEGLAKNLRAEYIDVKGKSYDDLINEFETKMKN